MTGIRERVLLESYMNGKKNGFISSRIVGMKQLREAAQDAIESFNHQVVAVEHFPASPHSPQVACLSAVRKADYVVLILGGSYGEIQPSGMSATHEEFREAREKKDVFAFIQRGVSRDELQEAFVQEVEKWVRGVFRREFSDAKELQKLVTGAIHQWEIDSLAVVDDAEMDRRAIEMIPRYNSNAVYSRPILVVAIAGGPRQSVLRPSEIDGPEMKRFLSQETRFGAAPIFDSEGGVKFRTEGSALVGQQGKRCIRVGQDGLCSLNWSFLIRAAACRSSSQKMPRRWPFWHWALPPTCSIISTQLAESHASPS